MFCTGLRGGFPCDLHNRNGNEDYELRPLSLFEKWIQQVYPCTGYFNTNFTTFDLGLIFLSLELAGLGKLVSG